MARHNSALNDLTELYNDSQACARLIGLAYIDGDSTGIRRSRRGTGFSYYGEDGRLITDQVVRQRIAELVIPPAWQEVWICPSARGHVLATGIDDKGRKQYLYHPKWRTLRDLIKFYRLLVFAQALPTIRRIVDQDLRRPELDRAKLLATMLWLLDNTYLRIGNEIYFAENESVGLTTLSRKHLVVAGNVSTLSFKAKSGKLQQISFDNKQIALILRSLAESHHSRLFSYDDETGQHTIESSDLNAYLHEITNQPISAKDFRTWGGTLLAFDHLVSLVNLPPGQKPKPDRAAVQAVDMAADVLGNTRAVAKASYVHPHLLQTYTEKNFSQYYRAAKAKRARQGLDKRETELISVLEQLFAAEFTVLRQR